MPGNPNLPRPILDNPAQRRDPPDEVQELKPGIAETKKRIIGILGSHAVLHDDEVHRSMTALHASLVRSDPIDVGGDDGLDGEGRKESHVAPSLHSLQDVKGTPSEVKSGLHHSLEEREGVYRFEIPEISGRIEVLKVIPGGEGYVFVLMTEQGPCVLKASFAEKQDAKLKKIRREASAVPAQTSSPHLVRVFSARHVNGNPFLAEEFVAGKTLRQILKDSKKLERGQAVNIFFQLLEAGSKLHEDHSALGRLARYFSGRGCQPSIVHGDIKPENIILREIVFEEGGSYRELENPEAVLIDLGFHISEKDEKSYGHTPGYSAPEVENGDKPTEASDVFSLGVTIFELIVGERPFLIQGRTTKFHEMTEIPGLKSTDPLRNILLKALALDPGKRFKNFHDMKKALADSYRKPSPRVISVSETRQREALTKLIDKIFEQGFDLLQDPKLIVEKSMEWVKEEARQKRMTPEWLRRFQQICEFSRMHRSEIGEDFDRLFHFGGISFESGFHQKAFSLERVIVHGAHLKFRKCTHKILFQGSDLTGCEFTARVPFHHLDIRGTWLRRIIFHRLDESYSGWQRSSVEVRDLRNAWYDEQTIFPEGILLSVNDNDPRLRLFGPGRDFRKTEFGQKDLSKANFSFCDLRGVDLRQVKNLTPEQLRYSYLNCLTCFPPDFPKNEVLSSLRGSLDVRGKDMRPFQNRMFCESRDITCFFDETTKFPENVGDKLGFDFEYRMKHEKNWTFIFIGKHQNLRGVVFPENFDLSETCLEGCNLESVDLSGAKIGPQTLERTPIFPTTKLPEGIDRSKLLLVGQGNDLRGKDLTFVKESIFGVDTIRPALKGVFYDTTTKLPAFLRTVFEGEGTYFLGPNRDLSGVFFPQGIDLRQVNFEGTLLLDADLGRTILGPETLKGAIISPNKYFLPAGADTSQAIVLGREADLRTKDLRRLPEWVLEDEKILKKLFAGARYDESTLFPEGFNPRRVFSQWPKKDQPEYVGEGRHWNKPKKNENEGQAHPPAAPPPSDEASPSSSGVALETPSPSRIPIEEAMKAVRNPALKPPQASEETPGNNQPMLE